MAAGDLHRCATRFSRMNSPAPGHTVAELRFQPSLSYSRTLRPLYHLSF
jgi:hypothetical protein